MSSKDKQRKKKAREKRVAQKKLAQAQKRNSEQPAVGQESNVYETSKLAAMAPIPKVDSVAGQNQRQTARRRASY